MKYYIRVDLGTSSVRALLIDSDGIQLAVAGVQYAVDVPRQGWAEQDPEEWYRKTCWVVSEAIEASGVSPEEIEAISFSGQMHGLVSLKEDRTPAAGSILWLDQRSDGAIEEIYQTFGREWVVQCTGNTIAAGFLLASLYWAKTHAGEFYDSIRWAFLPKDYVKYRLFRRDCDRLFPRRRQSRL